MTEIICKAATYTNARENNEDNYCIDKMYLSKIHSDEKTEYKCEDKSSVAFGVFDGLGGDDNGEESSYIAAKMLSEFNINEDIRKYYKEVNFEMNAQSRKGRKLSGTTAVIAGIDKGLLLCSNVGDSRAYIIRNGEIKQLTKDHTSIQAMIEAGVLTKEQAERSKYKNVLSQCLGGESEHPISPYVADRLKLKDNDVILLCSDGLTGGLSDEEIANIITENTVENTAEILCKRAAKNGSKDNITVVLIYICQRKTFISKLREVVKQWRK